MSEFIATTSAGRAPTRRASWLGEQLVVREPRPVRLEVAFHSKSFPGGELGDQLVTSRLRLQTERVAGEVGDLGVRSLARRRHMKQVALPGVTDVAMAGLDFVGALGGHGGLLPPPDMLPPDMLPPDM